MTASIYLNNAATSYPKPPSVIEAVCRSLENPPMEPGRNIGSCDPILSCREILAKVFGVKRPEQVVLTPSATFALNTAIFGLADSWPQARRIVATALEHNSVLRPLTHLERTGRAEVAIAEPQSDGQVSVDAIESLCGEDTGLIVMTHASNVTGCIQPVEAIADLAASRGIPLLIDAAQSAGCLPLDVSGLPGRIFVAFAGHKGLYGPSGMGGLIVPDDRLGQTIVGGTGVRSELLHHPENLPLRHEAGTMNLPGIAGLAAGAEFLVEKGIQSLGSQRDRLVKRLRGNLLDVERVTLSPLFENDGRAGIVSFHVADMDPGELGFILHESFGIELRAGLHCAPLAHRALGSMPLGSLRASVGCFNTESDVDQLAEAVAVLVKS